MINCPCSSNKPYAECCKPYHQEEEIPTTAEELMRSRYSAYVVVNGEYLIKTTYPSKRKEYNKDDLEEWGKTNEWLKLEITDTPTPNIVAFKAFYRDIDGVIQLHYERSVFQKLNNKWYYVSGTFVDDQI